MKEQDKYRIIEYNFPKHNNEVVWLESILKEFKIETKKHWSRESEFFDNPIVVFEEPIHPDLYELGYTCLADVEDYNSYLAEYLIEDLLCVTGYLEACLEKEME